MKIALFGANGRIGQRILKEALDRGHDVTAFVRDPSKLIMEHPNLSVKVADIMDPTSVAAAAGGQDVVISAYGNGGRDASEVLVAVRSLLEGIGRHPGVRLIHELSHEPM